MVRISGRFAGLALVLLAGAVTGPGVAHAQATESMIRELCTDTDQENCWVKAGAQICDKEQAACAVVPLRAPAKAIQKSAGRWLVETQYGSGWVNERLLIIGAN